jgi:predicted transcriptional regulator
MQIDDYARKERIMRILSEDEARDVINTTVQASKSVAQISEELGMSSRSAYRHINSLCEVGLLARDKNVLIDGGGKYGLYRSLVKSVALKYDSQAKTVEVDLIPNDNTLDKFLRFWTSRASCDAALY